VIAAALIGGLAAATLVHASLTIAVIVSVVAGGIGVVALFRSPARPAEPMVGDYEDADTARFAVPRRPTPAAPSPAAQPPRTAPPASFPADPVAPGGRGPATVNETVVQLVPLPGNGAEAPDASWWNSAQGAPPPPSQGAKRVPAPDLSTYLASTFIAQCPRCGAFRLDIQRARNGMDFRCEACEYTWNWQPGTPWPPVRVMPP
jgi:hypothetical protein